MSKSRLDVLAMLQAAYRNISGFHRAAQETLRIICESSDWAYGEFWEPDESREKLRLECAYVSDQSLEPFHNHSQSISFESGSGIPGRVWRTQQPEWWSDVLKQPQEIYLRKQKASEAGLHAACAVPVLNGTSTAGVLMLHNKLAESQDNEFILFLSVVSGQLTSTITQEQLSARLAEAQNSYDTLFDQLPVGVYRATLDGKLLEGNTRLFDMFAVEDLESIEHIRASSVYVDPNEESAILAELMATGESTERELQMKRADGVPIWVRNSTRLIQDQNGEPLYVQGVIQDITEKRKAQAALSLSEQRYQLLFERNQAGVFHSTFEGHLIECNMAFAQLLGYDSPEEAKSVPTQQYYSNSLVREETLKLLREQGGYENFEAQLQKKSGELIWVMGSARVIEIDDAESFLETIIDVTEIKRKDEETKKLLQRLRSLHEIDIAIANSFDLQLTLRIVMSQIVTTLNPDAAVIRLYDARSKTLELAVSHGFKSDENKIERMKLSEGLSGRVALKREHLKIDDLRKERHLLRNRELLKSFASYFGVPLVAKGELQGVMSILTRPESERVLDRDKQEFAQSIASQAAIAINNARLFNALHKTNTELELAYDATLEGWAKALELRDKESSGHSYRLIEMTEAICRRLEFNEEELMHVRRGALLHDIGKMAIPDDILNKPGPLDESEREVMKKHPELAHEWISTFDFLEPALDIPYCHHERWDGNGYPRGLKGEAIPISARVFAIVDAWDAMTHDRPYRKALSNEDALDQLRQGAGTQFDSELVDLFIQMLTDDELRTES